MKISVKISSILAVLICASAFTVDAQKKNLQISDYSRFRSVSATISDHGNMVAYVYNAPRSDDTLFIRNLDSGKLDTITLAVRPEFSDDEKWVAFRLMPDFEAQEKLRRDRKPVIWKAGLKNLSTGEITLVDNAYSMGIPKGSGWFAVQKNKAENNSDTDGRDLVMTNLSTGDVIRIGNTGSYSFNKPGTFMAYTVEAPDSTGNGVFIMNLSTGFSRPLDTEKSVYSQLTWNEEGNALAALRGTTPENQTHRENSLLVFTGMDNNPERFFYNPTDDGEFPENYVIGETGSLTVSEDLDRFFFGIREQKPKTESKPDSPPVANVDVWHWDDERIQTVQMRQATRDRAFTYLSSVGRNDKVFVALADSTMKYTDITRDGKWVVGRDNRDYISDWKERLSDYYRVNVETGERTLIVKGLNRAMGLSPCSRYFLLWKDEHIHAYDLEADTTVNLTDTTPVSFVNQQFDRAGEKPPYGIAGWTKDRKNIIVNSRYDLWKIPLDGKKGRNLTQGYGNENKIRFRYIRTDREERFIDMEERLLLSAFGQWTKKAGFSVIENGELRSLVYEEKHFSTPVKPKEAGKYFVTIESPREFPDYYITCLEFKDPEQVTTTNPFIDEYNWYSNVLIEYTNNDGERLQGVLMIPDTYESGDKLPMLVSFYEKMSHNLNRWSRVISRHSPMFPKYASNGYLVLLPDIHFRTGTTHSDMLECIEAAVNKVNELGYVDMDRIGLHGHSFSGQGGNHIVTQTDMFAAAVIGAGASNLVSDFNQIWASAGTNQHYYNHHGQGRFATDPYNDFELYVEQSAVHHAPNMNTPLLLLHGTEDGSVEWLQAIEFYNALRFNKKNVILLSYPGEGHHLARYENQVDFQTRMEQFFDHYLKESDAPEWVTKGVPFLEKER